MEKHPLGAEPDRHSQYVQAAKEGVAAQAACVVLTLREIQEGPSPHILSHGSGESGYPGFLLGPVLGQVAQEETPYAVGLVVP